MGMIFIDTLILEKPKMVATDAEMRENNIPVQYRDYCAHVLIKLNQCRRNNYYLPWKCEHERHHYEVCQYKDWKRRCELLESQKNGQLSKEENH